MTLCQPAARADMCIANGKCWVQRGVIFSTRAHNQSIGFTLLLSPGKLCKWHSLNVFLRSCVCTVTSYNGSPYNGSPSVYVHLLANAANVVHSLLMSVVEQMAARRVVKQYLCLQIQLVAMMVYQMRSGALLTALVLTASLGTFVP